MDHDVIEIPDSPVDLNDRRRRSILSPVPSIDLKEFENFEEEDVCLDDNANIEPALVREMEAEQDSDLEWEQDFNESNFEFSRGFGSEATPDQGPSHKDEANTEREQVLSSEPEHEGMHLERDEDIVSMTDSVMRPSSKDTTGQVINILWANEEAISPCLLICPFKLCHSCVLLFLSLIFLLPAHLSLFLSISHSCPLIPTHTHSPLSSPPTHSSPLSPPTHSSPLSLPTHTLLTLVPPHSHTPLHSYVASSKLLSSNLLTGQSKVHVLPPVAKGLALLTLKDLQLSKMWETHPAVKVKVFAFCLVDVIVLNIGSDWVMCLCTCRRSLPV